MPTTARRKKSAGGRPKLGDTGARERLLAAAQELFYQRGIQNVGIDEVIAVAGVAKASLYKHFESKDALIAECVRVRDADWRVWLPAEVDARAKAPRAKLVAVFDVLGDWLNDSDFRGCAFQNAVVEVADPKHAAHKAATQQKVFTRAYLADLARNAGVRNASVLADQLAMLMEGAIVSALMFGAPAAAATARTTALVLIRSAQK